jgi:drug/metabolite transporter (DMT)-like permease
MTPAAKAHIAVFLTNLFFAANYSFVKFISPSHVGPYGLNILRVGISLALFWLLWVIAKATSKDVVSPGIQKKHIWRFFLCGLTGVALNQMLFIKGLTMTSAIHASLLMLCTPLLITLFAFWVLKEKVTLSKAAGLALGIGGAVMLILSKEPGNSTSSLTGDVFIIMNAIAYTFYFILVKPLMQEYTPVHVMRWVFTFGFLLIIPLGWGQFMGIDWSVFEPIHFLAVTFIVFFGTFLAYLFNVYGIRQLGAGITGAYIYTQPILAAVIASIFLKEILTTQKLIAGGLIFVGVFLVSRSRK